MTVTLDQSSGIPASLSKQGPGVEPPLTTMLQESPLARLARIELAINPAAASAAATRVGNSLKSMGVAIVLIRMPAAVVTVE
jgi:hypothetical protein